MVFDARRKDGPKAVFLLQVTTPMYSNWNKNYVWLIVNGEQITEPTTLELEEGTQIDCVLNANVIGNAYLYLNGVRIQGEFTGENPWHYLYRVHCPAVIEVSSEGFPGGNTAVVRITEQ